MFRKFNLNCTIRILMAGLSITALILAFHRSYYATAFVLLIAIVFQIHDLLHYVNKTNRDLSRFLSAIENADFSQSFSNQRMGDSFKELSSSFTRVVERFQNIRAEKEENFQYLQTIVRHVGTGLFAFRPEDKRITLFNNAAKRIIGLPHAHSLSDFKQVSPDLEKQLNNIDAGQSHLIRVLKDGELKQLSLHATRITLRREELMLVSIQDIHNELEDKEMESWQKLIRVLTHEIMNSITPIGSLASTATSLLTQDNESPNPEELADIREALDTISRRSDNLLSFVHAYRNLTRVPKPEFETVDLAALLNRIHQLLKQELLDSNIKLEIDVRPPNLTITADPGLIEQVIINLIVNAIHALEGKKDGKIRVAAGLDPKSRVSLHITDNGPGIDQDAMDKIFIPFFTTKKNGSGIGLSLSRQIMRVHKGSITATSVPGVATTFLLKF